MAKEILIKPIITEKADKLGEDLNQYTFLVNRGVNKIEIKKAVEKWYNVQVESVNTMVLPGKRKTRNTKGGVQKGATSSKKKAIVTLVEGEEIDLFGDI